MARPSTVQSPPPRSALQKDAELADGIPADGRRLRREQNRAKVVDALLSLLADGNFEPSAVDIASRAGLSPRSLFRYFDDVDDLTGAAVEQHLSRVAALVDIDAAPGDPLAEKVEALARSRVRLWRSAAPGARVARLRAHRNELVAGALRRTRAELRHQLRELFAPELATMEPPVAEATLAAADVLCSFESVELLFEDQGLRREQATEAIARGLLGLFGSTRRPPVQRRSTARRPGSRGDQ